MKFVLQVLDSWGLPRKARPYHLMIDGIRYDGVTDEEGILRHFVPNAAKAGKLYLDDLELDILIGFLEPKAGLLGVQQRLSNLGFHCLNDNGEPGQSTVLALMRFQRSVNLPVTGEPDDATRKAIDGNHQDLNRFSLGLAALKSDS